MIYKAAQTIAVKKNQDRVLSTKDSLILCDGVGSFDGSNIVADLAISHLQFAAGSSEIFPLIKEAHHELVDKELVGGTTVITALIDEKEQMSFVRLAYLGNGSIYHFHGNLFELPPSYSEGSRSFRYTNLLVPHVDGENALIRHISHNSTQVELQPTFIDLSLTGVNGDVIFLFTDGITSLEDDVIIVDDQDRLWRYQSENVNNIFSNFHLWLKYNSAEFSEEKLDIFLKQELLKLKSSQKLEDDASVGVIITDRVLEYYKKTYHA
jgi:hypothetical protein